MGGRPFLSPLRGSLSDDQSLERLDQTYLVDFVHSPGSVTRERQPTSRAVRRAARGPNKLADVWCVGDGVTKNRHALRAT